MNIESWITRSVQSRMQPGAPIAFAPTPRANNVPTILVDDTQTYQPIEGFGFALTGGSAQQIAALAPAARIALLAELFGTTENSIGLSCLRLTIGASDLSARAFSYCDLPPGHTDPTLATFNLLAGDTDIIPVLQEILAINPALKLIASPWSAPPWMKDNEHFIAGSLKPECYPAYAHYFVKYVQAMRARGIHISAITPQNEPLNRKNEPSMVMQAPEQAEFIKHHLGPALRAAGLNTEIICFDHNCDTPEYPLQVLADPEARAYIAGVAWHLYAGSIDALTQVQTLHPAQKMYFTEQWVQAGKDPHADFSWHIQNVVIGALRNGCRLVLEWNLAADPLCNPHTPRGAPDCLGGITIGDTIARNAGYDVMAHTARFLPPGSRRISSSMPAGLPNVALLTPDSRIVMIAINNRPAAQEFYINYQDATARVTLDAGAVLTLRWSSGTKSA